MRTAWMMLVVVLGAPVAAQDVKPAPEGLAALYPGDEGIERDPRVLFADDFESGDVKETVERWGNGHTDGRVAHSDEIRPDSPGRRSLRIKFGHLYTHFKPSDRVHVRYYMRFDPQFGYPHHLPFLLADRVPTPWPKGFAGKRPVGDQFFGSALDCHSDWGKLSPPGKWMFYSYWQEMKADGRGVCWGNNMVPPQENLIERGRWYCLEVMIKANSKPELADGEQSFWVDGKLVGEFKGFRWRSSDRLKLNSFWLLHDGETGSTISNDPDHAKRAYDIWFDDLVIATEYIGPVRGAPKAGKKVGAPGRSAKLSGDLLAPPGRKVYSEKFEQGPGAFKGGEILDGALAAPPAGVEVWNAWSTIVKDSSVLRFRAKPTADVDQVQVLIWSDKLKDNVRAFLNLRKGEWTTAEIRLVELCAGWSQEGPSLDGSVMNNFKLVFSGGADARILVDDVEVFE